MAELFRIKGIQCFRPDYRTVPCRLIGVGQHMNIIHIGSESEFVRFGFPGQYSDEGWATIEVEISVAGFRGLIAPSVEATDFQHFHAELLSLHKTLTGRATFAPIEDQVNLTIVAGTGGQMAVSGHAWSQATYENKLSFGFVIDQTFLAGPLSQLQAALGNVA